MQKMIATKNFPYGFNERKQGDQFEAHDHDVAALEVTGLAKPIKGKGQKYETKVMTAETEAKQDPQPAAAVPQATSVAAMTAQGSALVPTR